MSSGRPGDIPLGAACAWPLMPDASIAAQARHLLGGVMGALAFPREAIEDGRLAVSELAANAYRHARPVRPGPFGPVAPPELWVWARAHPRPELVVTVFDGCRDRVPAVRAGDPLAEHGRGLAMVAAVCGGWGTGPSRSRLAARPVAGKTVWFALPLPDPWPGAARIARPSHTAGRLHGLLARRGVTGTITTHAKGVSLVAVPSCPSIRVEPVAFGYTDADGAPVRRPLTDIHDLAEHLVQRVETFTVRRTR
ncbi:hypothetical protein DPM19_33465 [Actinomadura craniellae]|uniref:Histidine kinase/HSP90-like ATPase domain-containing protein n=1 Tax=Actinomadura craniellae TaxID=2231787 RepID=A0A365GVL6_9ACTN|nr:ATP-binding protein [Actinomadura craniellae]RAY10871.1 hypothetical protein DPM19_33465 [Actinomadura craniellae]